MTTSTNTMKSLVGGMLDDDVDGLPNLEREDVRNFDKLFNAAQCKAYFGCAKTVLAFIVKMLHVKVFKKSGNETFDMIMKIIKEMLPIDHEIGSTIPWNIYDAKKFLRDLGLGHIPIHACKYDYSLFWKENANLENCPTCNKPRYKVNDGTGKKIPHKLLRYLPLTPRLQRPYYYEKTVPDMRWHKDKRVDDEELRHPADGKNICDNLVRISLGINGKNKDKEKAQKDMEDQEIRKELHLKMRANGTFKKPPAITVKLSDLDKLQENNVLVLCKLEKIFLPVFFDVMVHLAIHVPRNVRLGGLIQYRWMYPIEKLHKTLLEGDSTIDIAKRQRKEFPQWFKGHMNELRNQGSPEATKELWSLANGLDALIDTYLGCISNGVRFHTIEHDNQHINCIMGPGSRKTSASSNSIKLRGIAEATTSVPPPIVASTPPIVLSLSTGAPSRRVQGPTLGKRVRRLIEGKDGTRLRVYITQEMRTFCGANATKVANELGSQIRRMCHPTTDSFCHSWKLVYHEVKRAVTQAVRDKYEVTENDVEYTPLVEQVFMRKANLLYKD
ncbi:hypothetical protein RHSIM_Rhsim01G0183600 [Rhododendron simsii]|uniref:DUF4218 domain-containing protein n=1 Tax=Rhododendron simsii TaxID=118357 RepID=A0A834HJY5_RHOSS|nr:hypothetical protein RHSIM_Rhsim01G0183600 [Rhododendron simsii]